MTNMELSLSQTEFIIKTIVDFLNRPLTHFKISAIVGYWRCGATFDEIAAIMEITTARASEIVNEYLKAKSLQR